MSDEAGQTDPGTQPAALSDPIGRESDPTDPAEPKKPEVDWKARAREWEKRAKENKTAADELTQIKESQKSAEQKLAEAKAAAESDAANARQELLRYKVAADKQLPASLAARLQGSTQEELEADAEALLKEFGTHQVRQTPSFDGGARTTAAPTDMNSLIRKAAGY